MSVSPEHERPTGFFTHLIQILTEELGLEYISFGSSTLRSESRGKGKEPDDCFYIGDLERIMDSDRLDMDLDPPPDLAIEVDITNPTLNKFPLYAGLGVPELWRYENKQIEFYRLEGDHYVAISTSDLFSFLTPKAVADAIARGNSEGINSMRREFRNWVQANSGTRG